METERKIIYKPAIGLTEGKPDYFWSDERRELAAITTIVIHSMFNPEGTAHTRVSAVACIELLAKHGGLSCHYFVERDGQIYLSVDEVRMAWQAGKSKMPAPDGREKVNAFSIGIELLADTTEGFTDDQYASLVWLVADIMRRIPTVTSIVGHNDIAGPDVRPDAPKTDPENFDWPKFMQLLASAVQGEYQRLQLISNGSY